MKKTSSKIVFFGSGPVAAKSLKLLLEHQEAEAVITKPSTVQEMKAVAPTLPLFTVGNKAELDQLVTTSNFTSKLAILIDFGIIVSRTVIDSFRLGIINSHFSLLPEWRGADPITFAILSGQAKTGVSLMVIDEGMDTGKILTQKSLTLSLPITSPELTAQLVRLSDQLLKKTIPQYISGAIKPRNQPHPERATYSRKLTKEDGVLDFNKPAEVLEREIRAFLEWPKSRTVIASKDSIITKAHATPSVGTKNKPGDITIAKDAGLIIIATTNGSLCIERLTPAGKKEMTSKAFLAGHKL